MPAALLSAGLSPTFAKINGALLVLFLFSYWLFFLEKKLAKMRKKPASQPINQPAHAQCFAAAARQRTGLSTQSTW